MGIVVVVGGVLSGDEVKERELRKWTVRWRGSNDGTRDNNHIALYMATLHSTSITTQSTLSRHGWRR